MSKERTTFSRTFYGFTCGMCDAKITLLMQYLKDTGNGEIVTYPMYYELNTDNYHQRVYVNKVRDFEKLLQAVKRIECEVMSHKEWWRQ